MSLSLLAGLLLSLPLQAQDRPVESAPLDLPELWITAERAPSVTGLSPYATSVITREDLDQRLYRSLPQVLRSEPGILVQETSYGQGSPYVRGFTGYRNLVLIDGVRLNNSVFRSGPNQYWNTIDPYSIERIEIVRGGGSVLHGSDSIGGTIGIHTREPELRGEDNSTGFQGRLTARYSTAEKSVIGRAEASYAAPTGWSLGLGVTAKDFGDFRAGGSSGLQRETGYKEWDADFKLVRRLGPDERLVLAYQTVRQSDVPRTHKTIFAVPFEGTTSGTDLRRELDQRRELAYAQLHGGDLHAGYRAGISWHGQEEERDRVRSNGNRELQGFDVDSSGIFAQRWRENSLGRLLVGFDFTRDEVDSFLRRLGNATAADEIQGPVADDATYDLFGVFAEQRFDLSEKLELRLGARFESIRVDADSVRDPVTDLPFEIEEDWQELVGSVRFEYQVSEGVRLFGGTSQGFRAPNLSDLSRFDTARTNEFEIPSPDLDPETALSHELGVAFDTGDSSIEATVFYTTLEDGIVRFPTGNTNGSGETEIQKANVGDGWIFGVELRGHTKLDKAFSLFGNATYLEGRQDTFPTSAQVVDEEWFDRLMPPTVQLGVRWDDPRRRASARERWVELLARWSAKADRLSTRDENDTSRIPPGGTPAYVVVDLAAGIDLDKRWNLGVALENLFDADYRVHGSGTNMPGRNLIVQLTLAF